ncbi:hypothetical protein [Spirabiliibacterium falconis]|uniref:hypothetical protein n=1 Tax=Spirabiliibacterium falconis TaxID=572023 RepID=UPI001AADB496|nr:hypothetical protein [Spirabiliibacterium falconis]MBE2895179.1 hypothetical protein [Spirabiliibacterium falconis]
MKKSLLLSLLFTTSFLVSCTTPQHIQPQQIRGVWGCTTKYDNLGVGTKDIVDIKADGHFRMTGIIFDHFFEKLTDKKIDDYFSSILKYSTSSEGQWQLNRNELTYEITQHKATRLISPKLMAEIQKSLTLKAMEQAVFDIYSKKEVAEKDKIELVITQFEKHRFTAEQAFDDSKNISVCKKLANKEDAFQFLIADK